MRRQQKIGRFPQRMIRRERLDAERINCRARNSFLFQGANQCHFVHERATFVPCLHQRALHLAARGPANGAARHRYNLVDVQAEHVDRELRTNLVTSLRTGARAHSTLS